MRNQDYDATVDKVVRLNAPRQEQKINGKLVLRPARLPDPETLQPRQWLYGTQLIRGFVTVLVAPGGTGKSAYAMASASRSSRPRRSSATISLRPSNVAIINLDDPMDELRAARRRHHDRPPHPAGRIWTAGCSSRTAMAMA